jgi:hypothetical protein
MALIPDARALPASTTMVWLALDAASRYDMHGDAEFQSQATAHYSPACTPRQRFVKASSVREL